MAEYIIQEKSLIELADIIRDKFIWVENDVAFISDRHNFHIDKLPSGIISIGDYAFRNCTNLALTSLPEGITSIGKEAFSHCQKLALTSLPESLISIEGYAFYDCNNLRTITFNGTPTAIESTAFYSCANLTTINVPWSESIVANAPWGATNATINYNYV